MVCSPLSVKYGSMKLKMARIITTIKIYSLLPTAEWTMDVVGGVPTASLDGATVEINRKATAFFLVHVIH